MCVGWCVYCGLMWMGDMVGGGGWVWVVVCGLDVVSMVVVEGCGGGGFGPYYKLYNMFGAGPMPSIIPLIGD